MKKLLLLISFTTLGASATQYNEFVEVSEGLYASISEDGTLTEIATTQDAKSELEKELTLANELEIKQKIVNNEIGNLSYTKLVGKNMCHNSPTSSSHKIELTDIPVFGFKQLIVRAKAHYGSSLPGPFPPAHLNPFRFEKSSIRTKAEIVVFNNNTYLYSAISIDRADLDYGTVAPYNDVLNVNIQAVVNIDYNTATHANWVVRSDFVSDGPYDLYFASNQMGDCYGTQMIRTSNSVNF